ncbi:MAG: hypothetical protein ABIR32_21185 [Ilumatobacteraceae bacterium]
MPEPGTPQDLRARAARLRSVARRLNSAQVLDVYQRAGPDVWIGPTPHHCLDDLLLIRSVVLGAADDLRSAAHNLELRADQLAQIPVGIPR